MWMESAFENMAIINKQNIIKMTRTLKQSFQSYYFRVEQICDLVSIDAGFDVFYSCTVGGANHGASITIYYSEKWYWF